MWGVIVWLGGLSSGESVIMFMLNGGGSACVFGWFVVIM